MLKIWSLEWYFFIYVQTVMDHTFIGFRLRLKENSLTFRNLIYIILVYIVGQLQFLLK